MKSAVITWRIDFNDADPTGWFTFAAYGICCVLCIRAARIEVARTNQPPGIRHEEIFGWRLLGWLTLGLGLNKELDLQVLAAQIGRALTLHLGWYQHKLLIRIAFLAALAIGGGAISWKIRKASRGFWRRHPACIAGVVLLLAYAAVRSVPWSQLSQRNVPRGSAQQNSNRPFWPLEIAGILAIGANAVRKPPAETP